MTPTPSIVDLALSLRARSRVGAARWRAKKTFLKGQDRADYCFLRQFSEQCPERPSAPFLAESPGFYLRASQQADLREALARMSRSPALRRAASRAVLARTHASLIRRSALFSRRWALHGEPAQAQAWADLLSQLLETCGVNPADPNEGFLPFFLLSFDFSRAPALLACAQARGLSLSPGKLGAGHCAELVHNLSHGWLKAQQADAQNGLCAASTQALGAWIKQSETPVALPLWRLNGLWAMQRLANRFLPSWPPEPPVASLFGGRFCARVFSTPARWAAGLAAQRADEGSVPRGVFEALLGRARSEIERQALRDELRLALPPASGEPAGAAALQADSAPKSRRSAKRL